MIRKLCALRRNEACNHTFEFRAQTEAGGAAVQLCAWSTANGLGQFSGIMKPSNLMMQAKEPF